MDQLKVSGAMFGGLAHKIRNPLAAVKLTIEVLITEPDLKEKDREALLNVVEEIRRIELLMNKFLCFAQPAAAQLMTLNINKILAETAQFLEKQPAFALPASGRQIIREFAAGLPETAGDPQQLQQVFLNILLNAAEAMPGGGTVTIKTWYDTGAGTIGIEVSDTGKGIPVEAVERIFEPFFTTKVQGIGLGLAVAQKLVEAHGGRITATGNKPAGAIFTVVLPLMKQ
jgi:two-component system NtrC family sensor kinase